MKRISMMKYGMDRSFGTYEDSDLERFKEAQSWNYDDAVSELKSGKKCTHWMWYVFPQLRALGTSPTANYYGIRDAEEAKRYLADEVLGTRLREVTELALAIETNDPHAVFGSPDDRKLCSSMTLFYEVSKDTLFGKMLDKYYGGTTDPLTEKLLREAE